MHQFVTDQGVLCVGSDGIMELFRSLDGRSSSRFLLWGCDAVVDGPNGDGPVTLTITRKRLPLLSLDVPVEDRAQAEEIAAVVRGLATRP